MFAKRKAANKLQSMLDEYQGRYDCCEDNDEKNELIDVIENLDWVIKELNSSDDERNPENTEQ